MSASTPEKGDHVVPLHIEELSVSRREVAGDSVRVSTVTREREQVVDEQLDHARVEVVRVPIGRMIDAVPPVREEGETTIMPVVEEVVVVERRLMLKEEVRIRRVHVSERHRETVMLREQEAAITRVEAGHPKIDDDRRSLDSKPISKTQERKL